MTRWFCVKLLLSDATRQTEIPPTFSTSDGSRRGQGLRWHHRIFDRKTAALFISVSRMRNSR
jgi:hypothetical protein